MAHCLEIKKRPTVIYLNDRFVKSNRHLRMKEERRGSSPGREGKMDQQKRIALITGAGGGLGVATSRALAECGWHVVIGDMDRGRADAAVAALRADGLDAIGAAVDVSDRGAVETLVAGIIEQNGRLDALVNMAGVARNDLLAKIRDEDFDLTIASHVRGTLNCMRACIPIMRRQNYGRIINMSSVASRGSLGGGAYGAAKGAIESMSRAGALELATSGITVNCVAPGLIGAGMFLTTPKHYQDRGIERTPMKRAGTPQEVAACIVFFASAEASFVTGQTLFVDGGLSVGF